MFSLRLILVAIFSFVMNFQISGLWIAENKAVPDEEKRNVVLLFCRADTRYFMWEIWNLCFGFEYSKSRMVDFWIWTFEKSDGRFSDLDIRKVGWQNFGFQGVLLFYFTLDFLTFSKSKSFKIHDFRKLRGLVKLKKTSKQK